ncbi:MAG TPA: methyltransferase domain-containing protein [Bryobacteraceae bacterium]|nr:methyltransferase domain-containing protein [Bryobacteraceae bacterium]
MPLLILLLVLLTPGLARPQEVQPVTGRHIAPTMSAAGADWLDRSERAQEEQPDKALDIIGLHPGMMVADVGAGTGYMSIRMARRVAPGGQIYSEDIQPEMLSLLRDHAAAAKVANIETILGTQSDPKLPSNTLDLVLLVDVYHEFSEPQKMLDAIRQALKPDGRLVLLEYRAEDPTIPIRPLHKMTVKQAETEVDAEGFRLAKVDESLPRQHILIFRKSVN